MAALRDSAGALHVPTKYEQSAHGEVAGGLLSGGVTVQAAGSGSGGSRSFLRERRSFP